MDEEDNLFVNNSMSFCATTEDVTDPALKPSKNDDRFSHSKMNESVLKTPQAMRRVDWRWAVAKGYLNRETNEWNESMGGKDAYLKQRNTRMPAR